MRNTTFIYFGLFRSFRIETLRTLHGALRRIRSVNAPSYVCESSSFWLSYIGFFFKPSKSNLNSNFYGTRQHDISSLSYWRGLTDVSERCSRTLPKIGKIPCLERQTYNGHCTTRRYRYIEKTSRTKRIQKRILKRRIKIIPPTRHFVLYCNTRKYTSILYIIYGCVYWVCKYTDKYWTRAKNPSRPLTHGRVVTSTHF